MNAVTCPVCNGEGRVEAMNLSASYHAWEPVHDVTTCERCNGRKRLRVEGLETEELHAFADEPGMAAELTRRGFVAAFTSDGQVISPEEVAACIADGDIEWLALPLALAKTEPAPAFSPASQVA